MRWYERALADPAALSPGDRAKALAGLGSALVFLERLEQARAALIRRFGCSTGTPATNAARPSCRFRLGTAELVACAPESTLALAEQARPDLRAPR